MDLRKPDGAALETPDAGAQELANGSGSGDSNGEARAYDASSIRKLEGIEAIRSAALQLGAGNPIAHHVTNVVITGEEEDGLVTAQSKGLMLMANGTFASVTHLDTLRRHNGGWRISHRVISPQRTPLGGAHLADPGDR